MIHISNGIPPHIFSLTHISLTHTHSVRFRPISLGGGQLRLYANLEQSGRFPWRGLVRPPTQLVLTGSRLVSLPSPEGGTPSGAVRTQIALRALAHA